MSRVKLAIISLALAIGIWLAANVDASAAGLSPEMEAYTRGICQVYNVDFHFVLAIIEQESMYRADAVSANGKCFGLMQINPSFQRERMEALGVTDIRDPADNVLVGVSYLHDLFGEYEDSSYVLMVYNGGKDYADGLFERGVYNTKYTEAIYGRQEALMDGAD